MLVLLRLLYGRDHTSILFAAVNLRLSSWSAISGSILVLRDCLCIFENTASSVFELDTELPVELRL